MSASLSLDLSPYAPKTSVAMGELAGSLRTIELWQTSALRGMRAEANRTGAPIDPRSAEEIMLEGKLRSVIVAFSHSSTMQERDKAEIVTAALANLLGSIVSTGCGDEDEAKLRAAKIADRVLLIMKDHMTAAGIEVS